MKSAADILAGIQVLHREGPENAMLSGVTADSRKIHSGFAFIAVKGTLTDGHQFITAVLNSGAGTVY